MTNYTNYFKTGYKDALNDIKSGGQLPLKLSGSSGDFRWWIWFADTMQGHVSLEIGLKTASGGATRGDIILCSAISQTPSSDVDAAIDELKEIATQALLDLDSCFTDASSQISGM